MRYAAFASSMILSAFLLSISSVYAKEDSIVTDRPDFVESSDTVGHKRFQIETGIDVTQNKENGVTTKSWTTPTLLRYGVSEDWELRLETEGSTHVKVTDSTGSVSQHGFSDTDIGAKWHISDDDPAHFKPAVALLMHATLPSGSKDFKGKAVRPSIRVVAEWDLPHDWSIGIMPGLSYENDETQGRYTAGIFGITFGKQWSEKVHSFIEFSSPSIKKMKYGGSDAYLDVGVSYLLDKSLQIDLKINRGLNSRSDDYIFGICISKKF